MKQQLIPIPRELAESLKPQGETGMGYQVVSVTLKNGKQYDQVVTSEGCVIQVRGYRDVPFSSEDMAAVTVNHRHWNFRRPTPNRPMALAQAQGSRS
jgi:hypothetical protein